MLKPEINFSNESNVVENNNKKKVEKQYIKLHFHWYIFIFLTSYFFSYFIPSIIFAFYIIFVFIPYFLEVNNIYLIFTNLISLFALLITPIVLIICILLRMYLLAIITRFFWAITEKKSPSKDGIIPRNIPSKTLNYYHIRSYLIKYPKYIFTKGMFPWLTNWLYNYVGTDKIGKKTTIEEQVCADKYLEIGDNCYIGVDSALASHLVDGTFGNITCFKVKVGNNVTFGASNNIGPGSQVFNNSYLLPYATGGKHYTVKGNGYYFGFPLRKIFKQNIMEYLKISEEDLIKAKILDEKQESIEKRRFNKD